MVEPSQHGSAAHRPSTRPQTAGRLTVRGSDNDVAADQRAAAAPRRVVV